MSFRNGRPLPLDRKDYPKGMWVQIGHQGIGYEDMCLRSKHDGYVPEHVQHTRDSVSKRGPDWPPPLLDTFRPASGEAHTFGADRQRLRQRSEPYERSENLRDRANDRVTKHIQLARGSVSKTGMIPAPIVFKWLHHRNAEHQMRHHIDQQSEEALYGDVEMGGPSHQLTVLIWNAGKLDRDGVSCAGIAQDNMSLSFITGKHHVSLIQEAVSGHAPAHWRSWGCVPMNGQICSNDPDNEVGDSSRGLRRIRKISP